MAYSYKGKDVPLSLKNIDLTISRIEKNMDRFSKFCDLTMPCRYCPLDEICKVQTEYYSMLNNLRYVYYGKSEDN